MFGSLFSNLFGQLGNALISVCDIDRAIRRAEQVREFQAFIEACFPTPEEPNPLPILMRAINRLRIGIVIKQPCWSRLRWRSVT